jgi:tetratricopeptide (TPR) repeat protein
MEPHQAQTPSGLPYFLDSRPVGGIQPEENLLSIDRTYAIMAAMWDKRGELEKKLDQKAFREKEDAIGYSMIFNLRNSTDAGFHRFVNKETNYLQVPPEGNIIKQHLIILTKFVLLDNLRLATSEYGSFDDLERPRKKGAKRPEASKYKGGIPGLKQLKRFVDQYYPEMITYPLRFTRKLPRDRRNRLFETMFTKQETEEHLRKVREMINYYTPDWLLELGVGVDRASEVAMLLRTYDPDDLAKLAAYRRDVERALKDLPGDLVGIGQPSHWMVEQFKTYRFTVKPMFEELRWYIELKWFQRMPQKSKLAILKTKVQFDYTAEDAKKAIHLASKWFEDDPFVFRQVLPVSWALDMVKKPEASAFLYRECQRQLKLPEAEQILWVENIAHVARWQGRIDEAIAGLDEALRRWTRVGPGQITSWILDHSWLAGLYLKKGDLTSATRHRDALLSLLPKFRSKASPPYQAHIFLQTSDVASGYGDVQLEKRLLKEGLDASLIDDKLEGYTLYFQQSLGDIARYGKRGWDVGPGRFPHPDSREWRMRKIGSNFYEARV